MHRLLPIVFAAGLSWAARAQPVSLTVISDGLHLRQAPRAASPSLAVLPFGAKVWAERDSIRRSLRFDPLVPENPDQLRLAHSGAARPDGLTPRGGLGPADTTLLRGLWWPVQYGELRGYLFSAFLYDGETLPAGTDNIELLSETGDKKLFWQADWFWYGLYPEENRVSLQAIRPYWMVDWDDEEGGMPRLVTDRCDRALFIIASNTPLPENQYRDETTWPDGAAEPVVDWNARKPKPKSALLQAAALDLEWQPGPVNRITRVWSKNARGTRQQLLPLHNSKGWAAENLYIGWYGDLDGDDNRDYILGEPDFDTHYTRYWLFLSSRAEKGKQLKMVSQAGFYDGF